MLTYDDIWTTFNDSYHVDEYDMPKNDEAIYKYIKHAVLLFNNRLQRDLECDDENEIINGESNQNDKLIIAQYIRLSFLMHTRDFYTQLLQGFEGDVGFKNFTAQLSTLRETIKEQEMAIEKFIFNTREDFL